MSDPKYSSSGTVTLVFGPSGDPTHVIFTPATHYTIEHAREKHAVFVEDESRRPKVIMRELKDNGIRIKVDRPTPALLEVLAQAAINSKGVDITVKVKERRKLKLRGAIVPARPHAK